MLALCLRREFIYFYRSEAAHQLTVEQTTVNVDGCIRCLTYEGEYAAFSSGYA
jgi:hypothetical protein